MSARKLDQPIAVGGTAEVYAWEPGWVLKLYFERYETGISEPVIIDWIDASIGSPLADVARTSILARGLVVIETQAAWTRRGGGASERRGCGLGESAAGAGRQTSAAVRRQPRHGPVRPI